jgi:hypothetical protein
VPSLKTGNGRPRAAVPVRILRPGRKLKLDATVSRDARP